MRYRKFGNTSLNVSETGFGAWAIGGGAMVGQTAIGWGDVDDRESVKAIHAALDAGVNFFDTADIYGLGHSEEILGKTLAGNKEVVIATKGGNVARDGVFTTDYSAAWLISACENSLRRLKKEAIDYYQLHTVRVDSFEKGECLKAMDTLQKQGKIRYWGISLNTFDPMPEAEWLIKHQAGNGFQLVLNMINQRALPLLDKAAGAGYGLIARMPLQFGLLTGKFDRVAEFADNDHRKKRMKKEVVEKANEALAGVWKLCDKYSCSKTDLAMRYIMSYPAISVVIPGIRTVEQARQNTAASFMLEPADMLFIENEYREKITAVMDLIQQQG